MQLLGQYKIRQLTTNNKTGDAVGITLPKNVKEVFSATTYFKVYVSGNAVILESGCKMTRSDIYEHNKQSWFF